jgi:hypothetical protein
MALKRRYEWRIIADGFVVVPIETTDTPLNLPYTDSHADMIVRLDSYIKNGGYDAKAKFVLMDFFYDEHV